LVAGNERLIGLVWLLPQVLVPIANGTEPMEAVITIDVLRRAGADVAVASVEPGAATVAASWGVKLAADALLADLAEDEFDLISLPVSLLFAFPALVAVTLMLCSLQNGTESESVVLRWDVALCFCMYNDGINSLLMRKMNRVGNGWFRVQTMCVYAEQQS
jgi:hypothetical protein